MVRIRCLNLKNVIWEITLQHKAEMKRKMLGIKKTSFAQKFLISV